MAPEASGTVRVGIIDMNAGHTNEAIRCIGLPVDQFASRVVAENRDLMVERVRVSPRDKGEEPPDDCDLYISSGGPGSPFDGDGQKWVDDYAEFLDQVVDENVALSNRGRAVFAVCY